MTDEAGLLSRALATFIFSVQQIIKKIFDEAAEFCSDLEKVAGLTIRPTS